MKIGIVTESFLPTVNGVTNSVLRILEHLAQEGHQALVIAPECEGGPKEYFGHRIKRVPALPVHNFLPVGMPMGLPPRKLESLIDGFGPDVLHLASPLALGAYAARVARRLSIPSLSVYQTDIAGFASHYGLTIAQSTLRKVVSKIHSVTDRTLVPSLSAQSELRAHGVENVYLWRRGVNTKLFHPAKRDENLRRSWRERDDQIIVGYVGRLANEKRISDLEILDRDSRFQLVITGDGPALGKLKGELENAIFTGFAAGEELARIYASLDLFVHPGPNETFCQAVQEALASGVPCIVPTTGGPADLVTENRTGYITQTHKPRELLDRAVHFRDRSDQIEMKFLARDSVTDRTWQKINGQLIDHYSHLISTSPRIDLLEGSAA